MESVSNYLVKGLTSSNAYSGATVSLSSNASFTQELEMNGFVDICVVLTDTMEGLERDIPINISTISVSAGEYHCNFTLLYRDQMPRKSTFQVFRTTIEPLTKSLQHENFPIYGNFTLSSSPVVLVLALSILFYCTHHTQNHQTSLLLSTWL